MIRMDRRGLHGRMLVIATVLILGAARPVQYSIGGNSRSAESDDEKLTWKDYWRVEKRIRHGWKDAPIESIEMEGKRQLFVDNVVIEHMEGVSKTLHQPVKHIGKPLLTPDKPLEGGKMFFPSVLHDDQDRLFKVWYQTPAGLCYAISEDGLHWKKPELNLIEYEGSAKNNLVLRADGIDSPTVIKDPYEKNPARRYKYFAKHNQPRYGLYVGFSADGIHWTLKKDPVLTSANDPGLNDRPTLMLDTQLRRYIAFTKREMINPFGRGDWGMMHRCRAVSLSKDFEQWTDPVLTLHPDDQDPPGLQIYGLVGFNYESLYLGLMDTFWSDAVGPRERTMDVQLALSRDGETWFRAGNRATFLPVGLPGSWDRLRVYPPNSVPIRRGEELWLYYWGRSERHGYETPPEQRRREPWLAPGHPEDPPLAAGVAANGGMGLARLRRDGFVSIDAGTRPGKLLTKPLFLAGNDIHLNVDARKGRIRAELFLAHRVSNRHPAWNWAIHEPLPGFSLGDCIPVETDATDATLRWKGGSLKQFENQPIVIRFEIIQSSLYSFWVQ